MWKMQFRDYCDKVSFPMHINHKSFSSIPEHF